ncbi:PR domain zinc finger protein 8 isoform X2 [Lonchura striata]|uniref:PR domain zinc finger protein 8 n=1 Tax=Lonchura striata TaxID=40157 RepID=A0A218UR49_9PASE|nr:PR domain zinc finger protein 8 [Lonchura striata domestica]OWK55910.1 PR domain zinc finger protein 8 [Lonchura striata domestica]
MEDAGVQRGIWDGDAKTVQQCLTDIFTSVYTTCDIPENAIFGPCVLSHTSLYDSIAFIALKSTDKRTVPYIFRVDTSAANGSSEGLMWLRLVQSAREREEQNLEAYIKSGQLFYRSLRRIAKDEELLVWYGKELTELLLLGPARAPARTNGSPPFACPECSQRFQFELPFAAHLRFRCPKRLHGPDIGPAAEAAAAAAKDGAGKEQEPGKFGKPGGPPHHPFPGPDGGPAASTKPSTDFHNLARELENSRGGRAGSPGRPAPPEGGPEAAAGKAKRRFPEEEERGPGAARGRFPAERPGLPAAPKEEPGCAPQQQYRAAGSYCGLEEGGRLFAPPSPETGEAKRSAFVEVKKAARGPEPDGGPEEGPERGSPGAGGAEPGLCPRGGAGGPLAARLDGGSPARGSAFSTVPQLGAGPGGPGGGGADERKSAFSQPARSFPHVPPLVLGPKLGGLGEPCPDGAAAPARLYAAEALAAKLPGGGEAAGGGGGGGGGLPKQSPFLYTTAFWPKSSAAAAVAAAAAGPLQLQLPSALTLLPPSFTSLCLPAQNWCAKCNASFRMTSDLVYHMRSHHKKEYALEPLVKRRREEKLKCPICNESFRERHHLSRHMTSHN